MALRRGPQLQTCSVKCNDPVVENGVKISGFGSLYKYNSSVTFECKIGYFMIGSYVARCDENGTWKPAVPSCKKIRTSPDTVTLNIPHGRIVRGKKRQYEPGDKVSIHCHAGYALKGPSVIRYIGGQKWLPKIPRCTLMVMCEDPIVEHGVRLSGFGQSYTYGNNITYECKIGYFMIGSYLIQCEENSAWNPAVPSCKQINPKLCGAPLIPNGHVDPLKPQYQLGETVVVQCNSQYSFPDGTIQTIGKCQGYNLWEPPVPPCVCRTSPDTVELLIHHGEIISGEKRNYEPGDSVIIQCYAGYTLVGPHKVRYIGGKRWFPKIPSCSLSFIFVLLIAGYKENCSTINLPKFQYSELKPEYNNLLDPVPSSSHVVYQCKENFHRLPDENGTIFCENGSWIYTNDSCGPLPETKCLISKLPVFQYSELEPKYKNLSDPLPPTISVVYQCKGNFHRNPYEDAGCKKPYNLTHARVPDHELENQDSFSVGTVFKYECNPGYQIIAGMDSGFTFCWQNLSWFETPEFCEAGCERPVDYKYARLTNQADEYKATFPVGTVLTYECNPGYQIIPGMVAPSLTCWGNLSWSEITEFCEAGCKRPEKLKYAKVPDDVTRNKESFPAGTTLIYECKPGFRKIPGRRTTSVICRRNFKWSEITEFCEEKKENCSISTLPKFTYSELEPKYKNLLDPLPPNISVVYRCKENFHRNPYEDGIISCMNGSWAFTDDSCGPGCKRPPDLKYARVPDRALGNESSFYIGAVIEYECKPGYRPIPGMDPSYTVCGVGYLWIPATEFCEASKDGCYITKLPKFEYSELDPKYTGLSEYVPPLSSVVYQCKENFHPKPDGNNTIVCVNGSWIHTNDSCGPGCKKPEIFTYASVPGHTLQNKDSFPVGSVLTYECNPGFQAIPGMVASSVVCRENLTWSEPTEFCEGIKLNCSSTTLPVFDYSELGSEYKALPDVVTYGTSILYKCKEGFHQNLDGNGTVICGNGSWIYNEDSCSPGCKTPEDLEYARVPKRVIGNSSSFAVGTVFAYECIPGYKVMYGLDPANVTCGKNLQWSKATEFCDEIKENCSKGDLPMFIYSELTPDYVNLTEVVRNRSHVEYKCKENFFLDPDGITIIVCDSGTWIPKEDPCGPNEFLSEKKVLISGRHLSGCERPGPMKYAIVPESDLGNATAFPIGTIFHYVCKPGYTKMPGVNETSVTCRKGFESGGLVSSEFCEGDCDISDLPTFNYSRIKRQFADLRGAVPPFTHVEYECKEGFYEKPDWNDTAVCFETFWIDPGDLCIPGCPKPKPLKYATVPKDILETNYFPSGTVVAYRCNRGYKTVPQMKPSEVTCRKNLTWTEPVEFCEGDCDTKTLPKMKYAKPAPKFENYSAIVPPFTEISYVCKEGFNRNPDENDTVTCMETSWTYNAEPCGPSCQKAEPIQFAHVPEDILERNYFPEGSILTYVCNYGYVNTTPPATVTCGKNLQWSNATEFCEASCKDPPKLEYGFLNKDLTSHGYYPPGKVLIYQCNDGYEVMDKMEPASVTCGNNLKWSEVKEFCKARVLQETTELKIRNAKIVRGGKPEYSPGDTVTVKCLPGFTLNGESVIEYVGGNEWSPKIPSCTLNKDKSFVQWRSGLEGRASISLKITSEGRQFEDTDSSLNGSEWRDLEAADKPSLSDYTCSWCEQEASWLPSM
ncbi:complement receptor type 1-like [Tiliqua scincoides]|uniref:complement receptor type 1-like n=1 Tax=Tiliqua scincoides TaxID=71010 RepID=UPI003461C54F